MMTTNQSLGWASLLDSKAPEGAVLLGALFTTYDRTDERLLVEDVLPSLLGLKHGPFDLVERSFFLLELDERLKQLHDRIVVVSSTLRDEPGDDDSAMSAGIYGWVWRSIRQLTVGKNGDAVQHAKLWMLHWTKDGAEFLEIVVSSCNLTRSAFRHQIQAAWRVCLPLQQKSTNVRLNGWGVLPEFMRALASSSGGETHLDGFINLLSRADCPQGITFVASVPGSHDRRTPWGAAGLRDIIPAGRGTTSATVFSPYIGSWDENSLNQWCAYFEGKPERISLVWIDKDHPWSDKWILPTSTLKNHVGVGGALLHLRHDGIDQKKSNSLHVEHRTSDIRWSHAKLYAFKRGRTQSLLLTSANFSTSAWGKVEGGKLTIKNFELGVCIEQANSPFENLSKFLDISNAATSSNKLIIGSRLISWAQATWDGKNILVECRSKKEVTGQIISRKKSPRISQWKKTTNGIHSTSIPWKDEKNAPASVLLKCETEQLNVVVFDSRKLKDRERSLPDEIDESEVQSIRDRLLFEQYGGKAVTDIESEPDAEVDADLPQDGDNQNADDSNGDTSVNNNDSYAVEALTAARQKLNVVDNWAARVIQAEQVSSERVLEMLSRDGRLLMEAFTRLHAQAEEGGSHNTGAIIAAEEMELRLKQLPKESR
ncbi:MAG: hypothetical protein PHI29_04590 [Gallionella sp.]|nr:hypothetical protein [Gallionella sp.]